MKVSTAPVGRGDQEMTTRRRKWHCPEQIVRKLREAEAMLSEGKSVGKVLQQLGVSGPSYHRWRNQYDGMKAEEAKRLKQLGQENAGLKKLVADQTLGIQILKEVSSGNW